MKRLLRDWLYDDATNAHQYNAGKNPELLIDELIPILDTAFYPNPVSEVMLLKGIRSEEGNIEVSNLNIAAKLQMRLNLGESRGVDVAGLLAYLYYLKVNMSSEVPWREKIINLKPIPFPDLAYYYLNLYYIGKACYC